MQQDINNNEDTNSRRTDRDEEATSAAASTIEAAESRERKEQLIDWLNDAYASELAAEKNIERQLRELASAEAQNYVAPLHTKLRQVLQHSRGHAERVREAIGRIGGDVSRLKSAGAFVGSLFSGRISGRGAEDGVVKSVVGNYASLMTQYGTYTAIAAAADVLDKRELANLADELAEEEHRLAEWFEGFLPDLVMWQFSPEEERRNYWEDEDADTPDDSDVISAEEEHEDAGEYESAERVQEKRTSGAYDTRPQ